MINKNSLKNLTYRFPKGNKPWNKGIKHIWGALNFAKWNFEKHDPWNKGLTKDKDIRLLSISKAISKRNKTMDMTKNFGKYAKKGCISPRKGIKTYKHSWNYKGITPFDKLERARFRKEVQKQVFKRDDYTCQICGIRGKDMTVDHIQSWTEYVELRFNIENCRTLCVKCHYQITFGKPMPPKVRAWGHNFLKGGNYL